MTTPPAHAAQTVDVSRDVVEELCVHLESVAWRPDSNGDPECFDEGQACAADMLRALLDAKEEAERSLNLVREVAEDYKETCGILSAKTADLETDNARLRRAIERKDECLRLVFKGECNRLHISAAIAYTGNDDTGG